MEELEKMINSQPLKIKKNIDPRVQNLLRRILKKNSSERLSCQQILRDRDFVSLLDQLMLFFPQTPSKAIQPKLIR